MPYANPEKKKAYQKQWYKDHQIQMSEYHKNYRKENRARLRERAREEYWLDSKKACEKSRLRRILYRATRPTEVREYFKNYLRQRRNHSPEFRILVSLRSRTNALLRGKNKSAKTLELVGCPIAWLEVHLESQFKPGMTWENYGPVWHIDHIRPCASFNLTNSEQQKICFHWTNLQPLFAKENLQKGDKYVV
jgi:hypothetical protein